MFVSEDHIVNLELLHSDVEEVVVVEEGAVHHNCIQRSHYNFLAADMVVAMTLAELLGYIVDSLVEDTSVEFVKHCDCNIDVAQVHAAEVDRIVADACTVDCMQNYYAQFLSPFPFHALSPLLVHHAVIYHLFLCCYQLGQIVGFCDCPF
jgi:hypothetical protein